jgi:hypothetical protein
VYNENTKSIEGDLMNELEGNERLKTKIMLPERSEALIVHGYQRDHFRGERPILDPQEREEIMRVLMESLGMRVSAHFKLYHEYEDCAVIGVVDKVDPYTRTFLVDGERFKLADIIKADLE